MRKPIFLDLKTWDDLILEMADQLNFILIISFSSKKIMIWFERMENL